MFYSMSKPVVFDKRSGLFWKSWKNPEEMGFPETLYNCTELGEIHALQLVSEYWEGDKSSFYSYELNLVLHDGSRTNVVDHGDLAQLRQDAKTLSEFLGIPLWDGILE